MFFLMMQYMISPGTAPFPVKCYISGISLAACHIPPLTGLWIMGGSWSTHREPMQVKGEVQCCRKRTSLRKDHYLMFYNAKLG